MVEDLLKGFVKEDWVSQCDFSTLEKVSGSYVSDDLRDREDDLIWRIRFQLESSRTEWDIQEVLRHLLLWLSSPEQSSLRRAFTVWFNRVLLPRKAPNAELTEFNGLHEVQTMLSETVKKWTMEWEHQGVIKGRQEGLEAGRLFKAIQNSLGFNFYFACGILVNKCANEGLIRHTCRSKTLQSCLTTDKRLY